MIDKIIAEIVYEIEEAKAAPETPNLGISNRSNTIVTVNETIAAYVT